MLFFDDPNTTDWKDFHKRLQNIDPLETRVVKKFLVHPDDPTQFVSWPLTSLGRRKVRTWPVTFARISTNWVTQLEFDLKGERFLHKTGDWFAAALEDEKIIAYAYGSPNYIKAVEVHPIKRNRGWGRALLAFVLERLDPWNPIELINVAGEAGAACYRAAAHKAGFRLKKINNSSQIFAFERVSSAEENKQQKKYHGCEGV